MFFGASRGGGKGSILWPVGYMSLRHYVRMKRTLGGLSFAYVLPVLCSDTLWFYV